MNEPVEYLYQQTAGEVTFSRIGPSPSKVAEAALKRMAWPRVWVKRASGGHWVQYLLVNGEARRAKSLRVGA